jgi:hypothetical protein
MNPERNSIEKRIEILFSEPQPSQEVIADYTANLLENLATTEKAMTKDFYRIAILFLAFLILDSSLVEKVSVAGTAIQRSGYVLVLFPFVISFFYYQFSCRVDFSHEIRTCLALIFRKLNHNLYIGAFDLLLHYPSIRNVETYQGIRGPGKKENFVLHLSTWAVTLVFSLGPMIAVGYMLYRAKTYPDLPIAIWIVVVLACLVFIVRSLVIGGVSKGEHSFSERKRI